MKGLAYYRAFNHYLKMAIQSINDEDIEMLNIYKSCLKIIRGYQTNENRK